MKKILYISFFFLILTGCSKDNEKPVEEETEDTTEETQEENQQEETNDEPELVIQDFSPKETFSFEEVTILVEAIEDSSNVKIRIGDTEAKNISIQNDSIRFRVPKEATTGELSLEYNDETYPVGELAITQEFDHVYAVRIFDYKASPVNEINADDGSFGEEFCSLSGWDQVNPPKFSRKYNVIYNEWCIQCGSGGGCSCKGRAKNLSNGNSHTIGLSGDLWDDYQSQMYGFGNRKLIYRTRNDGIHEQYDELVEVDLITMEGTVIWDYLVQGNVAVSGNSLHIESTNELLNISGVLHKIDLDDFSVTSGSTLITGKYPIITDSEDFVFGVSNNYTIIKIDPEALEVVEEIYNNDNVIRDLCYSESTGRFFWFERFYYGGGNYRSELHIYNPSNEIETMVEIGSGARIRGIFTDD